MPPKPKNPDSILRMEAMGFATIIVLTWVTEFVHLPHLLFDEPVAFNWHRAVLRTAVVLGIWWWVHKETKRLLKRLHHLEEFLLICSWCRKVGHEGQWLTMEQYFGSKFDTETSHGMCDECAKKARNHIPEISGKTP